MPAAQPAPLTPRAVRQAFAALRAAGATLAVAGSARDAPEALLAAGYAPRHLVELFGTRFFLSNLRQNPDLRFFVAWVMPPAPPRRAKLHARILYKDVSLVWRSASHVVRSANENWVGKGDVTHVVEDGYVTESSAEETTDLPLELQDALETLCRASAGAVRDRRAVELVLRNGPDDRIRPYADFSAPRRRAMANPANLVNGGRPVAWFTRAGDPRSLEFEPGFAPDFRRGVLETSRSESTLYGGELRRFRVLSANREIQYLFMAAPRQAWLIPPQATTTELSSFGVRTVDVLAHEDLCVPGYEYHYLDESVDPPVFVSQIPAGFAGAPSAVDPSRADASAWLEALPVIREFRRKLL